MSTVTSTTGRRLTGLATAAATGQATAVVIVQAMAAAIAPAAAAIALEGAATAGDTEVAADIEAVATVANRPDRDRSRRKAFLIVARQAAGL
jgi:hypothetical protein